MTTPIEIQGRVPDIKETAGPALAMMFPPGYRQPRTVVERHAIIAVKEYAGVSKYGPLPSGDYLVKFGDGYGDVRINNGNVFNGKSFGL